LSPIQRHRHPSSTMNAGDEMANRAPALISSPGQTRILSALYCVRLFCIGPLCVRAAMSDVRQSLTAVYSRSATRSPLASPERGRKLQQPYREHRWTTLDECGTPVCPHQSPSDNPLPSLHPSWLFLPLTPLTPAGCGRPLTLNGSPRKGQDARVAFALSH